ncbi:unnamed protein product [Rotaria sp. Silwood2]|nr:unnamed protein product [Rotaria sp. Silwood2]CAF2508215.1 unnamed protein product [Rotaria sp. Silwood2]CAF2726066.1 unnamed protein product [Rotaria sp. Silwood2]CAF3064167.1 unnamed protein product [Rotaria sp. Silwood2]CAF3965637.1 unnamed protein product [Rotaria sp. Silwood2]
MNKLWSRPTTKTKKNSSAIHVYHNRQFPLKDIVDVLYPLFGNDYPYNDLLYLIDTAHHIFCAYDETKHLCVGCALIKSVKTGGLYLSLFGVRQSSQHRGVGTQLLKKIIRWAYRTGHSFIYLHVHVINYKAIGLYEKVGFRTDDYLPGFYSASSKPKPDAFQMVLYFQ